MPARLTMPARRVIAVEPPSPVPATNVTTQAAAILPAECVRAQPNPMVPAAVTVTLARKTTPVSRGSALLVVRRPAPQSTTVTWQASVTRHRALARAQPSRMAPAAATVTPARKTTAASRGSALPATLPLAVRSTTVTWQALATQQAALARARRNLTARLVMTAMRARERTAARVARARATTP